MIRPESITIVLLFGTVLVTANRRQQRETTSEPDVVPPTCQPCQCAQGPPGPPGPAGMPGNHGNNGNNGASGAAGLAGEKGEKGLEGPRGKRGAKGDPGAPAKGPKKVAFSVQRNITYGKFGYDFDISFDHVILSIGDALSSYTSHVTAPVNGVYVFMFNTLGGNGNTLVNLMVNGVKYASAWGYHTDKNPYPNAGNQVIVRLLQDDRVWLKLAAGSTMNYGTTPSVLSFSGFLLFET